MDTSGIFDTPFTSMAFIVTLHYFGKALSKRLYTKYPKARISTDRINRFQQSKVGINLI